MDIVERLRAREHFDTWNGEFVSKDAADEIERLRAVLELWIEFWKADSDDVWLAEKAMDATKDVLGIED